jgi:hypothetical protein
VVSRSEPVPTGHVGIAIGTFLFEEHANALLVTSNVPLNQVVVDILLWNSLDQICTMP